MISFTLWRRIIPEENTDARINTEIENSINGVWKRIPSKLRGKKSILKNKNSFSFVKKEGEEVFETTSFSKRTDEYYRTFARETIENDILREQRYTWNTKIILGKEKDFSGILIS